MCDIPSTASRLEDRRSADDCSSELLRASGRSSASTPRKLPSKRRPTKQRGAGPRSAAETAQDLEAISAYEAKHGSFAEMARAHPTSPGRALIGGQVRCIREPVAAALERIRWSRCCNRMSPTPVANGSSPLVAACTAAWKRWKVEPARRRSEAGKYVPPSVPRMTAVASLGYLLSRRRPASAFREAIVAASISFLGDDLRVRRPGSRP